MTFFVVGYIENDLDSNDNYPVGVYDDKALAEAAANNEWNRLKDNHAEIFDGVDDEEIAQADALREFAGIIDDEIAVVIDTVGDMAELKGYFIAKGWNSRWDMLEINKKIG